MVFSSLTFLCCALPLCLGVYFLLPRAARNAWLLGFSLLFYAWGEPLYVLLMLASITFNWLCGLGLGRAGTPGSRRALKIVAIAGNLGALFAFKYLGFAVELLNALTGLSLAVPEVKLPLGISFYTFQALSYTLDVCRGTVPVQKKWHSLALYICFFPQLIAGPILRCDAVLPQLTQRRTSLEGFWHGLCRFVAGLSKKVLIANTVGALADEAFAASGLTAPCRWLGAAAYALQILFDFSGYSDMAIGLGRMFGFSYPENFDAPYTAVTLRDFWRRWHISLSTWFRDYVYIPLGGSRCGRRRHILNLLTVFALTGLWHGAGLNFLVWGLWHGALISLGICLRVRPSRSAGVRALQTFVTLIFVLLGWVLFRAESLNGALIYLKGMLLGEGSRLLYTLTPRVWLALCAGGLLASPMPGILRRRLPQKAGEVLRLAGVPALLFLCLLNLASGTYNPFIYFRF